MLTDRFLLERIARYCVTSGLPDSTQASAPDGTGDTWDTAEGHMQWDRSVLRYCMSSGLPDSTHASAHDGMGTH
jgi:hypothetical protein